MTDDLDAVLIGGREAVTVRIADHDASWAAHFEQEQARIAAALGETARRIEHIGSTAVPGLGAKPVVDILVEVGDPDDEAAFRPSLEAAGFALRVREPRHRMFRTAARDVHVHVWPAGSPEVADYLRLRDRLRADAADRRLYESVKRDLAGRAWGDMNEYADAKGPVIAEILARAAAERPA